MKHAIRSLAKTPGFTLVTILTLALGIGVATTAFSWIERVLLNPLPGVAEPHRVVALETLNPAGGMMDTSYPDFRDYQAQSKTLSQILVFKERPLNLGAGENTERVFGELVSGNFFDLLGVRPRLGRFFIPADHADDPEAAPIVVISESLWRRNFAADPAILGQTIKLNQQDFTVIGIAPASFFGTMNGLAFDVWVPVTLHARLMGPSRWLENRGSRGLHTLARLAPGATVENARAELTGLAAQLAATYPATNKGISIAAMPVIQSPHGTHRVLAQPLRLLLGVCGLLLVIVCANVSNLLLVRATGRQREISIRQALGEGRWSLIRQLATESLLLSAAGFIVGLVLTVWMSDLLKLFIPDATLPLALTAGLSSRVVLLALALSLGTGLVAGLAPALWATRPSVIHVLRATGRAAGLSRRADFFRRSLVVAQIATALVTLACTALVLKSFHAAKHTHPGFAASGVLIAALKLDGSGYTRDQAMAFLDRAQQRLPLLPGVESAAIAEAVPLGLEGGSWEEIAPPGYVPGPQEDMRIYRNLISPGYFTLMRIPLLHGRDFNAADRAAPYVAVVNESFARRYFGTDNAVGRTFSMGRGWRELTIVGVVKDIKVRSLNESAQPYFYLSLAQFFSTRTGLAIHLRTSSDPMAQLPALRRAIRELDPNVPIFEAMTLEDYTSAARFAQKAAASLLGVLSVISLALTTLGLYGVIAFTVAQRIPEIGVRLALGAQPSDIARLVVGHGASLIIAGLAFGLLGAIAASRGLAHVFTGISPFEPVLLLGVAGLVVIPALLACLFPARRAAGVDPVIALRAE